MVIKNYKGVESIKLIIAGVFDPAHATVQILGLMKGGILVSALAGAAGMMVRGRAAAAAAVLLLAFFIYNVMDRGLYGNIGNELGMFLTLYADNAGKSGRDEASPLQLEEEGYGIFLSKSGQNNLDGK